MSLNKRLLILKKGKPDYSRMTPFFSGLNATEKCKCNETFKKRVVSHIHKAKFLRMYGKNAKSHINLRVKPHSTFAFTAHFLPILDFISAIYGLKQKDDKMANF